MKKDAAPPRPMISYIQSGCGKRVSCSINLTRKFQRYRRRSFPAGIQNYRYSQRLQLDAHT